MQGMSAATRQYLENEGFQAAFCLGCSARYTIRGIVDEFGVPLEPDEATCPAGLEPGGPRCVERARYERIVDGLKEVEELWAQAS